MMHPAQAILCPMPGTNKHYSCNAIGSAFILTAAAVMLFMLTHYMVTGQLSLLQGIFGCLSTFAGALVLICALRNCCHGLANCNDETMEKGVGGYSYPITEVNHFDYPTGEIDHDDHKNDGDTKRQERHNPR